MRKLIFGLLLILGAVWSWQRALDREVQLQSDSRVPVDVMMREASISPSLPNAREAVQAATQTVVSPFLHGTDKQFIYEAAIRYLEDHRTEWGLQSYHEFSPELIDTPIGGRVRFLVSQDGLTIMGLQIEIRLDAEGKVEDVVNQYKAVKEAEVSGPWMEPNEILSSNPRFVSATETVSDVTRALFIPPTGDRPELVYSIPVLEKGINPTAVNIIFRARDGQVVGRSLPRVEF